MQSDFKEDSIAENGRLPKARFVHHINSTVKYSDIVGGSEEDVWVPNPLHSEELYSYMTKTWMHTMPTWSCASMKLSGEARDAYQDGSTNAYIKMQENLSLNF